MVHRKVLLVSLLLAALSASSVVEAKKQTKAGKKADLGASKCTNGKKGKKCKLERTKDKDIFASNDISIQLDVDGIEFVGGSRKGGKKQQNQWYGVSDDNFAMNLIESEGKIYGSYSDNDYIYSISTDDDGNPIVTGKLTADFPDELDADLDYETFSGNPTDYEEGAGEDETNHDNSFAHEPMRKLGLRGGSVSSAFLNTTERQLQLAEAHTTLDIMVVWTKNAECKNSKKGTNCMTTKATTEAMRGLIDLAVAETNVAFEESGIHVTLRMVYGYRDSSYTENGMVEALYDITRTNGQHKAMDDVHDKRIQYGADLVAMIVHEPASCGVAWLGPNKSRMFSVSHWDCATGYFSFGHEIGHNMVSSKR
jgi:hypothetical protein